MDSVDDPDRGGNASGTPAPTPAADPEPVAGPSGLKRPAVDGTLGEKYPKRLYGPDRPDGLVENSPKNAIMKLNESVPGLQFVVASASGPVHSPTFTVTVNYASQVFSGCGATKKQAKLNAAESVWRFVQHQRSLSSSSSSSSDPSAVGSGQSPSSAGTAGAPVILRSPLSLLNELKPGIKYEVVRETGQSHCRSYTMSVIVEGQEFTGTGSNKRLAKTRAARAAMETVYGCTFPPDPGASEPMESTSSDQTTQQQQQHRLLGDVISEMVLSKFSELTDQHTAPYSRYKVIAGVVMTTNDADPSAGARLVSMATGSKCIAGEFVSITGKTVTDLHAENLAVRGCRLFILKELQRLQMHLKTGSAADDPSKLIVQQEEDEEEEEVFAVKPSVKFHLFVSTAPCGHARILSAHEQTDDDHEGGDAESDMDEDGGGGGGPGPSSGRVTLPGARLRAKVESGEGTVPVSAAGLVQTWDGIVDGEKLLAMSCTDRITRWNVLGIQGSLLSHLMKPVYLDSIVIGRMYNNRHLRQAFYGRIDHRLTDLPADYRLNRPLISPITHPGARNTQKAPEYSVHWVDDGSPMEVIGAARGRLVAGGEASKISKSEFYREFVHLMEFSGSDFWRRRNVIVDRMTYAEVKAAAGTHRKVKVALYEALKAAGLGTWVHCPREQQEFTIKDY